MKANNNKHDISGEHHISPAPSSFMEIYRQTKNQKTIEYQRELIEIQNKIMDFKIKIIRKLRSLFYGKQ